jgi:hypothetical protein
LIAKARENDKQCQLICNFTSSGVHPPLEDLLVGPPERLRKLIVRNLQEPIMMKVRKKTNFSDKYSIK